MQQEILSGERLVWVGKPVSLTLHARKALPTALFGVPFLGFAIFWTLGAAGITLEGNWAGQLDGSSLFFPMFGIPFILVGLGLVLSPLGRMIKARKTLYALTDRRLIIRENFIQTKVQSWSYDAVGTIERTGPSDGPGSVFFATSVKRGSSGGNQLRKFGR